MTSKNCSKGGSSAPAGPAGMSFTGKEKLLIQDAVQGLEHNKKSELIFTIEKQIAFRNDDNMITVALTDRLTASN